MLALEDTHLLSEEEDFQVFFVVGLPHNGDKVEQAGQKLAEDKVQHGWAHCTVCADRLISGARRTKAGRVRNCSTHLDRVFAHYRLPVKTDRRDTLGLAALLATNTVPEVWVPPPVVRELRSLLAHRRQLVQQRRAAKNRLRSVLHRHNLVPPDGQIFALVHRAWWASLPLSPTEHLRTTQDLATITHLSGLIAETEQELARLSGTAPWADQTPWLIQLPGVGLITAMTILSAIGDITRFPSAKHLVGYSGLGAKVHASGQTHWSGGITKQGRTELRAALVEAAWAAVRRSPHWAQQYERLAGRIGRAKAIVAIARKLLVVIWHVLQAREADRHAEVPAVARRMLH